MRVPTSCDPDLAPHLCRASAQIYLDHLTQGQLLWSQPAPPDKINTALGAYRNRRNTRLEREVAATLRQAGYSVLARVKKPRLLDVPSLSGEMDILAGRADSHCVAAGDQGPGRAVRRS